MVMVSDVLIETSRGDLQGGEGRGILDQGRPARPRLRHADAQLHSSCIRICIESLLSPLPRLWECPEAEREDLILKKLSLCCAHFEFVSEPPYFNELKKLKRCTLKELDHYVTSNNAFPPSVYPEVFKMLMTNICRPIKSLKISESEIPFVLFEEDQNCLEPTWPHIEITYDFFRHFIASSDFFQDGARCLLKKRLILQLLENLNSGDSRVRKSVKLLLSQIYKKFTTYRPYIYNQIKYILLSFIHENGSHKGVAELLEIIYKCVIKAYRVPMTAENQDFFQKIILPLYKGKTLQIYHTQLTKCTSEVLEKNNSLAGNVISFLLKVWPKVNSAKEIIFIDEIRKVLKFVSAISHPELREPLLKQLDKCCSSYHNGVKETANQTKSWINYMLENKYDLSL